MFRVVLIAALVACALGAALPNGLNRIPIYGGRIVGGKDTTIGAHPHQISMIHFGSFRCGGSVISESVIITAAHCTEGTTLSALSIRAGTTFRITGGETVAVSRFAQHPDYNTATLDSDLSVMWLASPLTFGSTIQPIRIPEQGEALNYAVSTQVTGWGAISEDGPLSTILQEATLPLVPRAQCNEQYAIFGPDAITANMFCAGLPEGGVDACQGDSGGPVTQSGTLIGAVSWGLGCARAGFPGVSANIANMRNWVDSVL